MKVKMTQRRIDEIRCLDYFALPKKHYAPKGKLLPFLQTRIPTKTIKWLRQHIHFLFCLLAEYQNENILTNAEIKERKNGICPEEAYFLINDYGVKDVMVTDKSRLLQLIDAKKWRLRNMDWYEQGILEGSVPIYTLVGGEGDDVPSYVIRFMAKTIFKGKIRDKIMDVYQKLDKK